MPRLHLDIKNMADYDVFSAFTDIIQKGGRREGLTPLVVRQDKLGRTY